MNNQTPYAVGIPTNLTSVALDALWYSLDRNFEGVLRLTYSSNKDRVRALRIMSALSFMEIGGRMVATAHDSGSVEVLREACATLDCVLQTIARAVTSADTFERLDEAAQAAFALCIDGLFWWDTSSMRIGLRDHA